MKLQEKPYYLFLLSLLSGFLLWLGWPTKPTSFILFFAFVPLLMIEERLSNSNLKKKGWKFLGYSYIALLSWNVLSTYWIYNATAGGGIFSITCNALLMCVPMMLFHFTKRNTNQTIGYASFMLYWIGFEYWHLNWSLSWPWLTLGNAFASITQIVQWYEYTGAFGGTLWILLMNVCIYKIFKTAKGSADVKKFYVYAIALAIIPVIISIIIYSTYKEKGEEIEVVVVQPNIDPYEEKFSGGSRFIPYEEQVKRLIELSKKSITPNTRYVVWPETALPYGYFEDELHTTAVVQQLKEFVGHYPKLSLVTGLDTYKIYQTQATPSSSYVENLGYTDAFNSAMQINENKELAIYHKSKLVPGVEYMPPFISSFAIAMGEAAHGLGQQKERTVFFNNEGTGVAPVICYESIFGEFVTEYVKKGAGVIFIITNDGWWGNTQGYRQHLQFGTLRAIENRRCIARSANTGISGFIDERGNIIKRSEYWVQDVLRMNIRVNKEKTFYTKFGDYIGLLGTISAIVIFVAAILFWAKRLIRNNK